MACCYWTAACIVPRLPYPQPPDDSVISVPTQILDGYPARNLPRGIDDQGKQLVFINKNNPEIDVTGKVPREDLYVIIAEYYQHYHTPGYNNIFTINEKKQKLSN